MDIIESAIQKQFHMNVSESLRNQTWEQFEKARIGKRIFVYGAGNGLMHLLRNITTDFEVEVVIDNNKEKECDYLGWEDTKYWHTCCEKASIRGIECLKEYKPEEIVVLITSTKYYREMITELGEYGINTCYVMLMMEINKRGEEGYRKEVKEAIPSDRDSFVKYCCGLNIIPNKIVMSYGEYGGHAKYITKQLLKMRDDLEIVWLVHDPDIDVPEGVRIEPIKNWKSYTYELETAKIWLFDITVYEYIVKRPEQIYIQTKHWSSITLKKFCFDDKSTCNTKEIEEWVKYNGRVIDYMFVGSKFDEETSKSGFCYDGECVSIGSSRSDILFDKTVKERIFKRYNLKSEYYAIIYAPTYRQTEGITYYDKNFEEDIDLEVLRQIVKKRFGGEWYVLVRLHPLLKFEDSNFEESEFIINVSGYGDSQELVAAADVMVTDYSSIMFEPAFVKKPVFLYAPDKVEYIDKQRELLIDYGSLPFPIAESVQELQEAVSHFEQDEYEEKLQRFFDYYGVHEDGHASERAAKFIVSLL